MKLRMFVGLRYCGLQRPRLCLIGPTSSWTSGFIVDPKALRNSMQMVGLVLTGFVDLLKCSCSPATRSMG